MTKQVQEEKDLHIQLLKESLWDIRDQRNFFKAMNIVLCSIIFTLIAGMTVIGIYNQKCLKEIALYKQQETAAVYVTSNGDK